MASERMDGITIHESKNNSKDYMTGKRRNYSGESPEIIVFGDSHGLMWAKLLDDIAPSKSDLSGSIQQMPLAHSLACLRKTIRA